MLKSAIAILLTSATRVTLACSCLPIPDVAGEFERSELVVDGTVTAIEDRYVGWRKLKVWYQLRFGPFIPNSSDSGFAIRLKMHQLWKGESASEELVVYTPRDEAACGFYFNPGQRYVVYARLRENDEYEVLLCSRTRPREGGDDEVSTLDKLARSKKF